MRKLITTLITLAIAVGIILLALNVRKTAQSAADATPQRRGGGGVFAVRAAVAEVRTLQAYIEVNADIVSSEQVVVNPESSGRLVTMNVSLGSTVQRGQLLAEVDPSRPGTVFSLSPVYAPVSGRVVTTPVTVGSMVTTNTSLLTIAVNNTVEIEAKIPEREVGQLRNGLTAEVRLEAFPAEVFTATVHNVSPVIDPISRTKEIKLRFNRTDNRISPGGFARVKLNTRSYPNVISIPAQAIVEQRGRKFVYVLDPDEAKVSVRDVTQGVTVDGETEITAGIAAGEVVIIQGQQFLSDGAAVRVLGE